MNEKEPLGVPAGGGGSDGHGPGAPASPPSGPAGEGAPGKQAEGRPDGNPGPEQTLDRHVSRETSPHPPNGKRSSFYVYLAVLFGAAFLMLLLAYFVQRRNNETAISALRSTMDLSREELMEEIQGLEEEKLGASGSGKTTLLNMLSTIDSVTAGHIYYENVDITELSENKLSEFRKENLGFVFQEYNLLDTLTIEENILLALSLHQREKREVLSRCREMLDLLGIADIRDRKSVV